MGTTQTPVATITPESTIQSIAVTSTTTPVLTPVIELASQVADSSEQHSVVNASKPDVVSTQASSAPIGVAPATQPSSSSTTSMQAVVPTTATATRGQATTTTSGKSDSDYANLALRAR